MLLNVVQEANLDGPRMGLFPSREDWRVARRAAGLQSSQTEDMHAGELEVSLLLHARPDLVGDGYQTGDWLTGDDGRPQLPVVGVRGNSDSGVIGRPSLASPENGLLLLQSLAGSFKPHLDALTGAMNQWAATGRIRSGAADRQPRDRQGNGE